MKITNIINIVKKNFIRIICLLAIIYILYLLYVFLRSNLIEGMDDACERLRQPNTNISFTDQVCNGVWKRCASEKGNCHFNGTKDVLYGESGVLFNNDNTKNIDRFIRVNNVPGGKKPCNNKEFMACDPLPGVSKACYYCSD